jgi:hypothetical protein
MDSLRVRVFVASTTPICFTRLSPIQLIPRKTGGKNGTAIRKFTFVPDLLLGYMFAVALFSSYERNPVRHNVYLFGAFRYRWTGIHIGRHAGELFGDGSSWAGLVDFHGVVFCRYGYWQWVLDNRNSIFSLYIDRSTILTLQN